MTESASEEFPLTALEPTLRSPVQPPPPTGSLFSRAVRTLFQERRLPYRIQKRWDPMAKALGFPEKTVRVGDLKVRVRRLTSDEIFVVNIIERLEYTHDGFDIRPGQTVIDIGGNIGTFALLAAQRASRVITIEPNSDNYSRLQDNLARNGAANVTAVRAAVANASGTVTLQCAAEGGYHTISAGIRDGAALSVETVPAITLPEIFDKYQVDRCDFLKLDCEGAEYEILLNLPLEYLQRISRIALEWHGVEDPAIRRSQSNALVERLMSAGFAIETYWEYVGFRCGMIRATRAGR